MTLPDRFQDQDKPERLYAAAGLDAKAIVAKALAVFEAGGASSSISPRRSPSSCWRSRRSG